MKYTQKIMTHFLNQVIYYELQNSPIDVYDITEIGYGKITNIVNDNFVNIFVYNCGGKHSNNSSNFQGNLFYTNINKVRTLTKLEKLLYS